jgi:hypothetical protein
MFKNLILKIMALIVLVVSANYLPSFSLPNSWRTYQTYYQSYGVGLSVEKINSDNYRDIIVCSPYDDGHGIYYLNNGSGGFLLPYTNFAYDGCMRQAKLGQLNPNLPIYDPLRKEYALCNFDGRVDVYRQEIYGLFPNQYIYPPGISFFRWLDWGKAYGSNYEDLACRNYSDNYVYIYRNNSGLLETTPSTIDVGNSSADNSYIELVELDNIYDQFQIYDDLVCIVNYDIKVFHNNSGSFSLSQTISVLGPKYFKLGDLDNDGYNDLVTATATNVKVYKNLHNGTFDDNTGNFQIISGRGLIVALGELNYDGNLDLVTYCPSDNYLYGHLGLGNGTFDTDWYWRGDYIEYSLGTAPSLILADIHGKGGQSIFLGKMAFWWYYADNADEMPCPPKRLSVINYGGNPKLIWDANTEDDINHYDIYRRYYEDAQPVTDWENIGSVSHPTHEFIDYNTLYYNNKDHYARYFVRAIDHDFDPTALMSLPSNTVIFYCYIPCSDGEITIMDGVIPEKPCLVIAPNPFNQTTNLLYQVSETCLVRLSIFDISGKIITKIVDEVHSEGEYSCQFDGSNLPSGIYFVSFFTQNYSITQKLLLLR